MFAWLPPSVRTGCMRVQGKAQEVVLRPWSPRPTLSQEGEGLARTEVREQRLCSGDGGEALGLCSETDVWLCLLDCRLSFLTVRPASRKQANIKKPECEALSGALGTP